MEKARKIENWNGNVRKELTWGKWNREKSMKKVGFTPKGIKDSMWTQSWIYTKVGFFLCFNTEKKSKKAQKQEKPM